MRLWTCQTSQLLPRNCAELSNCSEVNSASMSTLILLGCSSTQVQFLSDLATGKAATDPASSSSSVSSAASSSTTLAVPPSSPARRTPSPIVLPASPKVKEEEEPVKRRGKRGAKKQQLQRVSNEDDE